MDLRLKGEICKARGRLKIDDHSLWQARSSKNLDPSLALGRRMFVAYVLAQDPILLKNFSVEFYSTKQKCHVTSFVTLMS